MLPLAPTGCFTGSLGLNRQPVPQFCPTRPIAHRGAPQGLLLGLSLAYLSGGLPGPSAVPSNKPARHALIGKSFKMHLCVLTGFPKARGQNQGRNPAPRRGARVGRLPLGRPATRRSRVENCGTSRAPARTAGAAQFSDLFGLSAISRGALRLGDKAGGP